MAVAANASRVRVRVARLVAAVCGASHSSVSARLSQAASHGGVASGAALRAATSVVAGDSGWRAHKQHTSWRSACAAVAAAAAAGGAAAVSCAGSDEATTAGDGAPVVRPEALARHAYDFNWDGCEAAYDAAKKAGRVTHKHASRFVVLMRHGQYESDEAEDARRVLTAKGRLQVAAAARYLQRRLHAHPFTADPGSGPQDAATTKEHGTGPAAGSKNGGGSGDFSHRLPSCVARLDLVTSSMTRAMETSSVILDSELGQLIANRDSVPVHDALREDRPVSHALRMAYHQRKHARPAGDGGDASPVAPLAANPKHADIEDAFFRLLRRPEPDQAIHTVTLVSGHANIIRYFVTRAMQVDPSSWISLQLPNASVTVVRVMKDGRVFLYNVGDTGGMAAEEGLVTYK